MNSHVYVFFFMGFFVLFGFQVMVCNSQDKFISWYDLSLRKRYGKMNLNETFEDRVIVVSKDGSGDSTTVQGAINLVPHGNSRRVKILILPGIYREKILVPITKPYVSFIGKDRSKTVISWNSKASDKDSSGQVVGTFDSATVAIEADFFCARSIIFENTSPGAEPGAQGMQAVALRASGDRSVFFRCKILGSQDTLFDHIGRHFFYKCYIRGSIDFIFGKARSLYQGCILHAKSTSYGAIAASQRTSLSEDSGFSFVNCKLKGSGIFYLGRAWGTYSTVVYSKCNFANIIIPEGWNDWGDSSRRRTVTFGEYGCSGGGAERRERVPWSKSLNYEEAKPFMDRNFIQGRQWLRL